MIIMNNKIKSQNRNIGFSLIELLVAMTIGLFLLAGIATSYVSSKGSSVKNNEYSVLEDNGRIALEIISQAIEHTGYRPINAYMETHPYILDEVNVKSGTCTDSQESVVKDSIFTSANITADDSDGDTLAVMHFGDNNVFSDCGGQEMPAACRLADPDQAQKEISLDASKIYSAFYLSGDKLLCAGSRGDTPQTVTENIENIQFLYGVASNNSTNTVDRYLNAADMTEALWNSVVSIQVAILVRSSTLVNTVSKKQVFTLLDQVVTSPDDRYQRAVFTATVRLRNSI